MKINFKKHLLLSACMIFTMVIFCACGNGGSDGTTDTSSQSGTSTTTESGGNSDTTSDKDTSGSAADDVADGVKDAVDGVADGVKDVADGVADGVKDVADGVFKSFDDAQDWFMNQLPSGDGRFEIANSDKDLTEYSDGKTGYHLELHDNNQSGDTKVGDFYVDAESGKVYKSDDSGKTFAEYDFSDYK